MSEIKRVSILDTEWRTKKETGQVIEKTIVYDTGGEKVAVTVPIRVLAGTESAAISDATLVRDESGEIMMVDGKPKVNTDLSEAMLISLSTGLSLKEVDELKRSKPLSFFQKLSYHCNFINGYTATDIQAEKN